MMRWHGGAAAALIFLAAMVSHSAAFAAEPAAEQYRHGDISVPAASAEEPVRMQFSPKLASEYLDRGALAWTKARNCVSCHTNGTYLQIRPALTPWLGRPPEDFRKFFVDTVRSMKAEQHDKLLVGIRPTQVAYVAAGL